MAGTHMRLVGTLLQVHTMGYWDRLLG